MGEIRRRARLRGLTAFAVASICGLVAGSRSEAQCSSDCSQVEAGHHWDFEGEVGNANSESVVIGMWGAGASGGAPYYGMACRFDPFVGWVVAGIEDHAIYPSRFLQDDVSICMGSGNDTVVLLTDVNASPIVCNSAWGPFTLRGFMTSGELWASGEDGSDDIRVADFNDSPHISLCGGDGNDALIGNVGEQYIVGGDDADFVSGGNDYDNVSGSSGNDVIRHGSTIGALVNPGKDYLRGQNGNDCFRFSDGTSYDSRTTCGPTSYTDTCELAVNVSPSLPPPGCNDGWAANDNCCSEPGKFCPWDYQ